MSSKPMPPPGDLFREGALCAWFALVGLAFWAPYLGLPLPAAVMTAGYGLFLVAAIAALALRLLRRSRGSSGEPAPLGEPTPLPVTAAASHNQAAVVARRQKKKGPVRKA